MGLHGPGFQLDCLYRRSLRLVGYLSQWRGYCGIYTHTHIYLIMWGDVESYLVCSLS